MGFFDDLDKQVAAAPESADVDTSSEAVGRAIDKIAAGKVWESVLQSMQQRGVGQTATGSEERVKIVFSRGRFQVTHSRVENRRDRLQKPEITSDRSLDREGLVELLRDQPLVARKLVIDMGGKTDPDRPDGATLFDPKRH